MISKQLVEDAHSEAIKVRDAATVKERSRLNFDSFDPLYPSQCIYGQLTGDCYGNRAKELIRQCAAKLFAFNAETFTKASCSLDSKDISQVSKRSMFPVNDVFLFSPIETYIAQTGADNEQLLKYLHGDIDTLNLSHTINC